MSKAQSFALVSGPVNDRCICTLPSGDIVYLARDWNIYRLSLPPNAPSDDSAPGATLLSPQAQGYIKEWCDPDDTVTPHMRFFADSALLWIWAMGKANVPVAFVFDTRDRSFSGPVHDPPLMFADQPEGQAVICGASVDGRPLYFDPSGLVPVGDVLNSASATPTFATPTTATLIEGEHIAGFGSTLAVWTRSARILCLQWNWFDPMPSLPRKTILAVRVQFLPGSAGLLCVSAESDVEVSGVRNSSSNYYGEVYGRSDHIVPLMVSGRFFRLGLSVVCAEGRYCVIRNVEINPAEAGQFN